MKQMDTILKAVGIKTKECQQEEKGSTRLFSPLAKKSQRAAGSETQGEENTVQEEDGADSDCQAPTTSTSMSSALTQPVSAGTSSDGNLHPGDDSLANHYQDSPGSLLAESSPPCPTCPSSASSAKQAAGDNRLNWISRPSLLAAQRQLHRAILSLLPYTVCRASRAGCELLPCSSQGCRVAGWEAAEPSANPHFAWPAGGQLQLFVMGRDAQPALKLLSEHNQWSPQSRAAAFRTCWGPSTWHHSITGSQLSEQSPSASPTDKKRPILVQISIVPQEAVAIPSLHKLFSSWGKQLPPLGIIFLVLSSWESRWFCGYL